MAVEIENYFLVQRTCKLYFCSFNVIFQIVYFSPSVSLAPNLTECVQAQRSSEMKALNVADYCTLKKTS